MRSARWVVPIAVVSVVTAVLWYLKVYAVGPNDPVFFYLLPITLIALLYGTKSALLAASFAFGCADYFLYDPLYSFDITTMVEFGDLACFTLLTLLCVKCVKELFRPRQSKFPFANIRHRGWR